MATLPTKDVAATAISPVLPPSPPIDDAQWGEKRKPLRRRVRELLWDSFDRSPAERRFIAKIDFFILTWAGFSYFSKNLNSNNLCKSGIQYTRLLHELIRPVANAYVSGMKEELNVVGNQYQTFTTMWTM